LKFITAIVILLAASSMMLSAQTFDAGQVFKQKCAMCHGADGKQPTMIGKNVGALDLSSEKVQKMSDHDLHETLQKGKGKMPAYGSSIGEKNLDSMVKYVRALKK
jgi:cytochrome c6